MQQMLIILGGLPGAGKTSIARKLAETIKAQHLRIDTIETAIKNSYLHFDDMQDAGYRVAYEIAKDNLRIGNTVIADSVNPIDITREAWRNVAISTQKPFIEIEIVCSDTQTHQQRVETRVSDINGLTVPSWQEVTEREYHNWKLQGIQIDTANKDINQSVEIIRNYISKAYK